MKLIASDVDGTLLRKGDKQPSEETLAAIRAAVAAGVHFVLASGRPYPDLRRLFSEVWRDVYIVSDAGALVAYRDEVLHTKGVERSLAIRLAMDIYARENCNFWLTTSHNHIYTIPKTEAFVESIREQAGDALRVVESLETITGEVLKVTAFVANDGAHALAPVLRKQWGEHISVMASGAIWVDCVNADKADAMAFLMERLGVDKAEFMAFGDNENDEGMLRLAGHAWAVEDAREEIIALCAGRTCKSVAAVVQNALADMR